MYVWVHSFDEIIPSIVPMLEVKTAVCYVNLVTHDDAFDTDGQKITDVIISE